MADIRDRRAGGGGGNQGQYALYKDVLGSDWRAEVVAGYLYAWDATALAWVKLTVNAATGNLVVEPRRPATGTQSIVAASATDVTILAANTGRFGATVHNDSTAVLYLLLANATSSTTVFTTKLLSGSYYEVPYGYTGVVKGIWASATGNARVTEIT